MTKAWEIPHRRQTQETKGGCEVCRNRTESHSQGRKAGDRNLYGILCYWASWQQWSPRTHHAHPPFTSLPWESKISEQGSSDLSACIGQFHATLWASRQKDGFMWAKPLSQDRELVRALLLLLEFTISLDYTSSGSPHKSPPQHNHLCFPRITLRTKALRFLFLIYIS